MDGVAGHQITRRLNVSGRAPNSKNSVACTALLLEDLGVVLFLFQVLCKPVFVLLDGVVFLEFFLDPLMAFLSECLALVGVLGELEDGFSYFLGVVCAKNAGVCVLDGLSGVGIFREVGEDRLLGGEDAVCFAGHDEAD